MINLNNKKAFAEVVAISLILLVLALVGIFIYNWVINYTTAHTAEYSVIQKSQITIDFYDPNTLYVRNTANLDLNYSQIQIQGVNCNLDGIVQKANMTAIDLNFCTSEMESGPKEVVIYSENGVFSEMKYLQSTISGDFIVKYLQSTTCESGYTKLYAIEYLSDAHAEIASSNLYLYSVCVKHKNYTVSNSCSGVYDRVIYLDDSTNAHAYTDNTSSYAPISPWYEVCLAVDSGSSTVDVQVNSTDLSSSDYSCLGSMEVNNTIGGHIGNCNAYSNKIWAKVS